MGSVVLRSEDSRQGMLEHYRALPTEDLKRELSATLGLTAANLLKLAVLVAVLEDRGEDLSALKGGFLDILRKIAAGELLPDLVVLFSGSPEKILKAAKMPVDQQKEVLNGKRAIPDKNRNRTYSPRIAEPAKTEKVNVIRLMGQNGTPRDVGETAAEMVVGCPKPAEAVMHLIAVLKPKGLIPDPPKAAPPPPAPAGLSVIDKATEIVKGKKLDFDKECVYETLWGLLVELEKALGMNAEPEMIGQSVAALVKAAADPKATLSVVLDSLKRDGIKI